LRRSTLLLLLRSLAAAVAGIGPDDDTVGRCRHDDDEDEHDDGRGGNQHSDPARSSIGRRFHACVCARGSIDAWGKFSLHGAIRITVTKRTVARRVARGEKVKLTEESVSQRRSSFCVTGARGSIATNLLVPTLASDGVVPKT
jgi:hypothetical protein